MLYLYSKCVFFVAKSKCAILCACVIVPRAQKREDQRAAGSPAALTQLALRLRLASILRPKADNAPKTLDDSTPQ